MKISKWVISFRSPIVITKAVEPEELSVISFGTAKLKIKVDDNVPIGAALFAAENGEVVAVIKNLDGSLVTAE